MEPKTARAEVEKVRRNGHLLTCPVCRHELAVMIHRGITAEEIEILRKAIATKTLEFWDVETAEEALREDRILIASPLPTERDG